MNRRAYKRYLKSPRWRQKAKAVRQTANNRCEDCNTKELLHVHHLTYDRVGHERPTDLIAVCKTCHEKRHKINKDNTDAVRPTFKRKIRKLIISEDDTVFIIPFKNSVFFNKNIKELPNWYIDFILKQKWFKSKFKRGYDITVKEQEYRNENDIIIKENLIDEEIGGKDNDN